MSSSHLQNPSQDPASMRPISSASLRASLHIPVRPRPISQETTYTDRSSRRGSLETNPPHLSPGERPQIMTARPLNLGPQVPTPPPSPPLLERKSGVKKLVGLGVVGVASLMVILMIVIIVLVIAFGLKQHSSTIYVQATVPLSNGTEVPALVVAGPKLVRTEGCNSTKPASQRMADEIPPEHHTFVSKSTFIVDDGIAMMPTSEVATKQENSMVTIHRDGAAAAPKQISSTVATLPTAVISPASVVTTNITVAPQPAPTTDQSAEQLTGTPPQAFVTVNLQFTIKESSGNPSMRVSLILKTLSTLLLLALLWYASNRIER